MRDQSKDLLKKDPEFLERTRNYFIKIKDKKQLGDLELSVNSFCSFPLVDYPEKFLPYLENLGLDENEMEVRFPSYIEDRDKLVDGMTVKVPIYTETKRGKLKVGTLEMKSLKAYTKLGYGWISNGVKIGIIDEINISHALSNSATY